MLYHGVSVGYFTGDPLRLLEDAQVLQPTFFPAVPRILNKIYQGANAAGNTPGLRGSFNLTYIYVEGNLLCNYNR